MLRVVGIRTFLAVSACVWVLAACGGGGGDDGGGPVGGSPPPDPGVPVVVDTTPPSVPGGLTATTPTSTQVLLTWNASTDDKAGVAGYRVYRDGGSTPIATVTVTNYTDTGLAANSSYVYTVRAFDAASPANESALTNPVSISTPPPPAEGDSTPPTVPTNVTAIATSAISIQISWIPSVDASGISAYRVFRVGTPAPIAVTLNTSFTDSPVETNTTYTYYVTAVDGATPANESAASDPASATTGPGTGPVDTTPPTVPGNVRVDARSSTVIRIRWQRSMDASDIAEYRIYRDGAPLPIASTDDNEYLDENLTANTTYSYSVTAVDGATPANESAHSPTVSATTDSPGPGPGPGDIIPPDPPQNLVATARSSNQIELNWSPSTDPSGIANYAVYRDGATQPIATVQTTSYTDGALSPSSTHTYTVRATDNAAQPNTSGDSAPATATTSGPPLVDFTAPTVPQDVVATAQSPTSIAISWSPSTDASGIAEYRIYRNGNATPIGTTAATDYVDNGLAPGTNYSYTVRAVDRAFFPNVSAASAAASATTP